MDALQPQRNDAPARMEALAKLPVFWSLQGQRAIVAGGSDAAAWKAELLAACGAEVHVYAPELSETFAALVGDAQGGAAIAPSADGDRTDRPGGYVHHPRDWDSAAFAGAALAIADCEDDADAQSFHEVARAAGVPVNVIDKPACCQFQFGSIVNRSPVDVAISTDGAAPILAQAIRRRIETLLPRSLKSWAELAQGLRERVNERLLPGPQRRAFWERFVDRAFATVAAMDPTVTADRVVASLDAAKDLDLGLIPPWTPSRPGIAGYARVSNSFLYFTKVQDGQERLVSDDAVDVAPFVPTA